MSQTQKCRGTATKVKKDENGNLSVVYHNTEVVNVSKGVITLRTGGYKTATTRTRMQQASHEFRLGYGVFQKDYAWFVAWKGVTLPFDGDSITLPA